jgi:uncharacterized integral membrane protein (TIGR00698 family)
MKTWQAYQDEVIEPFKTSDLSDSQPTKGNILGGLTTIEEKALGNLEKIGRTSTYIDVLEPAEAPAKGPGLYFMDTSSAAAECVTLMAAAGYVIHTFPTGQGNVVGNPIVPVIKISGNPRTLRTMSEHIDVDVTGVLSREMTIEQAGDALIEMIRRTANGRHRGRGAGTSGILDDQALPLGVTHRGAARAAAPRSSAPSGRRRWRANRKNSSGSWAQVQRSSGFRRCGRAPDRPAPGAPMVDAPAVRKLPNTLRALFPGLLLCTTIAAAATFLSDHYGGPAMLFALLLGIAFNFLSEDGSPCKAGVEVAARFILRLGVGLLGIRITMQEIAGFGWQTPLVVAGLVALTILTGFIAAAAFGRRWRFALIDGRRGGDLRRVGGARHRRGDPAQRQDRAQHPFTVIAVTTLSTVAMVIYPVLFGLLGIDDREIGFLIGATIHDVAQVVGAAYSVSDRAGDAATVVKLMRVALLPVVLIAIVISLRAVGAGRTGARVPLLPWFMVLFIVLSATATAFDLPGGLTGAVEAASRGMLVTAIAALGVKTSIKAMLAVGGGHVAVVTMETLVLLGAAILAFELFLAA